MSKEPSKTAIEKVAKEMEMLKIISALENAGLQIDRISDFGTLGYMVKEGVLEGRYLTIKVVLTKETNEETGAGFNIFEAIEDYEMKVNKQLAKGASS